MKRYAAIAAVFFVCLPITLSAGTSRNEKVIRADGSPLPDALVACEGAGCWIASGHFAPTWVQRSSEGPIELPAMQVDRLLVLSDRGDRIVEGSIRWIIDDLPEGFQELSWQAKNGRLDLLGPVGVVAEVMVEGYARASIPLEPGGPRRTVVLQSARTVKLNVRPAKPGKLLLAARSDLHLLSKFSGVANQWEIPESGELELKDLPGNEPILGVVFVPDWAPVVGSLPVGRDEITIALTRGCLITGVVRDEEGSPVAGAEVTGIGTIEELDRWKFTQHTITDAEGQFNLRGFLAEPVTVRAWKESFAEASLEIEPEYEETKSIEFELSPGADLDVIVVDTHARPMADIRVLLGEDVAHTDPDGRVRFKGRTLGEEVELRLDGEAIVPLTRTVPVNREVVRITVEPSGTIHWPLIFDRKLVKDEVVVRWSRRSRKGRETATGSGVWDGDQSLAAIRGLQPGIYVVSVRIPDFENLISDPVDVSLGEMVVLPSVSPAAGVAIFGRVVASEDGTEIAGAVIKVERGSPRVFRDPFEVLAPRTTCSNEDGSFHLGGLEIEEHRVRVEAAGRASTVIDDVVPEEGGTDLGVIELGSGLTIDGEVTDRQGRAVPSAIVTVREPHPYAYFTQAETSTDRNGRFRVERLTPGEWKIEATAGSGRASKVIEGWDHETVGVELMMGGVELEGLILRGDLPVSRGRVSLSTGQSSAQGIVVLVDRGPGNNEYFGTGGDRFEATVDSEGEFTIDGVDPGTYTVGFRSDDGRSSGSASVTIPDVPRHMAIVRLPSGSVEGTVVDPEERPVAGAKVDFHFSSGGMARPVFTDGSGAFRIDGRAGSGDVVASHDSFEPSRPEKVIPEEGTAVGPIVLRLGSKRESGLKVLLVSTSAGAVGAPVTVAGPESRLEFTDLGGVATFSGLPEGTYQVCGRVFGGAAGCLERTTDVSQAHIAEIELGLSDGGWVKVISSSPVDGASFQVVTENGADLTRALFLGNPPMLDGDTAVFGPLLPGRYAVSCSSCTGRNSGVVDTAAGETAVLDLR